MAEQTVGLPPTPAPEPVMRPGARGGARRGTPTWRTRLSAGGGETATARHANVARAARAVPAHPSRHLRLSGAPTLPTHVEWAPTGRRDAVAAAVFVAAGGAGAPALLQAMQHPSPAAWRLVVACVVAGLLSWADLALRTTTVVTVRDGALEVARGGTAYRFDLADSRTHVDLSALPAAPWWRARVSGPAGHVTLRRAEVEPRLFTRIVAAADAARDVR